MKPVRWMLLLTALGGLVANVSVAIAVPLDAAACSGLDKERSGLEASGVIADLHLKADDIKALPKDKFARVEHYVDISGQILFRCLPAVKAPDVAAPVVKAALPQKRRNTALRKKS